MEETKPTILPWVSNKGPPELPGFIKASVCIILGMTDADVDVLTILSTPDTIPEVRDQVYP